MIRYNTTTSILETYTTDWLPLTIGALYTFTSPFTFTNAGATGRTGPSITDLTDTYTPDWTDSTNNLNVSTQGIQEWTVPETGTYTITAIGAQGGSGYNTTPTPDVMYAGGRGAWMQGDFALTQGDTLHILVGQQGIGGPTSISGVASLGGGGGGGTFVSKGTTLTNSVALIVAGGGGGGTYHVHQGNPNPTGNPGLSTIGSNANAGAVNSAAPTPSDHEGAGFTGNAVTGGSNAAKAFKSGGVGGQGYSVYHGGFGGGGGGSYSWPSGGGGGGYQGGAAALSEWTTAGNGGGGLSYNDGTNPSGVSGSPLAVGHGSVIILKL
tara:strand:- start:315 stop:1283 length:969 start_codon:yes stop_codon:yes gene_type:complete